MRGVVFGREFRAHVKSLSVYRRRRVPIRSDDHVFSGNVRKWVGGPTTTAGRPHIPGAGQTKT